MSEAASSNTTPSGRVLWKVGPPTLRGLGRALFDLRVEREAELPAPPFVIAANHYSHFDPPVIGAAVGMPIRFLALEDLFGANKVLDWLLVGLGAIPTARARYPITAVRTALRALEAGDVVGLFPEATRVSRWGALQPRPGAAWLAVRARVPLVPIAVVGTGRALGLENRLRPARVRVVIGGSITSGDDDIAGLTDRWAAWVSRQIERYPESEPSGPPKVATE